MLSFVQKRMIARRIFARAVLFFWSLNVSVVLGQKTYIAPLEKKVIGSLNLAMYTESMFILRVKIEAMQDQVCRLYCILNLLILLLAECSGNS